MNRAAKEVTYYEKIVAALEAGYVLLPSMQCDVFAVRTKAQGPYGSKLYKWSGEVPDVPAQMLPQGEGRYLSNEPFVGKELVDEPETRYDPEQRKGVPTGAMRKVERFFPSGIDEEIQFPLVMAKPEIIRASSAAISLMLFDELGIVQDQRQGGDPIIIGRIIKPGEPIRRARRASFMIAWYVDTREL